MSVLIEAENLGKKYKQYPSHWARLGEWMTAGRWNGHHPLWAIRHVTFSVDRGEAVGVVGQNGAGKTTLLKVLVGTTAASEGNVRTDGRVSALLELGMGFHPEFSGYQNAVMALQMMGFDLDITESRLPEIVEFSELGDFMDQPLRTYSSGMQMRLGFAVATTLRPDLLIVDEALSVGDAYFQHKCIRRIRRFKEEGTTMLFVSHDPAAVRTLCDRALLLDGGRLIREDSAEAILDYYNALIAKREKEHSIEQEVTEKGRKRTRSGDRRILIEEVAVTDLDGLAARSFSSGETIRIRADLRFQDDLEEYAVGFLIRDRLGNEVYGTNTTFLENEAPAGAPGDRLTVRFEVKLDLGYGYYTVSVAVHGPAGHLDENHDWIDHAASFQVIPEDATRFAGVASLPARAIFQRR